MKSRVLVSVLILFSCVTYSAIKSPDLCDYVTIAILAKDKEHTLPFYLSCIEEQTWPKEKTYLYIRTNNNNDETPELLREWVTKIKHLYAGVYFDDTDVTEQVEEFKQHEWNGIRFKVLGKIRQDSLEWSLRMNSHYFVVDCDNFILPETLEKLMAVSLPIVAPFLRCVSNDYYSNYHQAIDKNGYFAGSPFYYDIYNQTIKGLIEVPVVHCTYLVRNDVIHLLTYDDESWRYEYVIFSDSARKQDIGQYIDNRILYGYVSFAETTQEFEQELPKLYNFFDKQIKQNSCIGYFDENDYFFLM